jgi:serine O-acetyltransferase
LKEKLLTIKIYLEFVRCFPHLLLFYFHKNREVIKADVDRWIKIYEVNRGEKKSFLYLLSFFPEFRNLFYYRVGAWKFLLNPICPKMPSLYILTDKIGKGLFIQHGFATIIAAKSIGENCWINQQVTVGFSNKTAAPYIRDNVTINAGAKVIGGVRVGNNAVVGANAVVVKNVPDNCTVVGVPAQIIKRNGIKVCSLNLDEQAQIS